MRTRLWIVSVCIILPLCFYACKDDDQIVSFLDDDPVIPSNFAPEIPDQVFNASEEISETDIIGKLVASDPDGHSLHFSIISNDKDLFEISTNGELSLGSGKELDHGTDTAHIIMVMVTDDLLADTASVEINVLPSAKSKAFITLWHLEPGDLTIYLPIYHTTKFTTTDYDFYVDWGDGRSDHIDSFNDPEAMHEYDQQGEYKVSIKGTLVGFSFGQDGRSSSKLIDVMQWGDVQIGNDGKALYYCVNLKAFSAPDAPDLSDVTNLNYMFTGAVLFNGHIGHWDVSNVTSMEGMFRGNTSFNQDIGSWDVSSVIDMRYMFKQAEDFDRDIGEWDVSNVQQFQEMFFSAFSFNQNIGNWDVSSARRMTRMFLNAGAFDQDLRKWNTVNVIKCYLFSERSGLDEDDLPTKGCFE